MKSVFGVGYKIIQKRKIAVYGASGFSRKKAQKAQNSLIKNENDIFQLCDQIRVICFDLNKYLRYGHLEKVYEYGLANRLRKANIEVEQQYPLKVYDEDGTVLGEYFADLFIESKLLVELKASKALAPEHTAQLLGYLRACQIEHGLLINFGAAKFQIRKYALSE